MKKMPAFFSWAPGRCRAATEEGEKTCLSNFAWFVLRTNALTPPSLPQAGEGFSLKSGIHPARRQKEKRGHCPFHPAKIALTPCKPDNI